MMGLVFIEVRAQMRLLIIATLGLILTGLALKTSTSMVFLPTLVAFILHYQSKRSHWYSQLPFSRKKIASLLALQSLALYLLTGAIAIAAWLALGRLFPTKTPISDLATGAGLTVYAFSLSFMAPLSGVPKARQNFTNLKFDWPFFKSLAIAAALIGSYFAALNASEKLTLIGTLATYPIIAFWSASYQSMVAPTTLKKVRLSCLIVFGILVATLLACYLLA